MVQAHGEEDRSCSIKLKKKNDSIQLFLRALSSYKVTIRKGWLLLMRLRFEEYELLLLMRLRFEEYELLLFNS